MGIRVSMEWGIYFQDRAGWGREEHGLVVRGTRYHLLQGWWPWRQPGQMAVRKHWIYTGKGNENFLPSVLILSPQMWPTKSHGLEEGSALLSHVRVRDFPPLSSGLLLRLLIFKDTGECCHIYRWTALSGRVYTRKVSVQLKVTGYANHRDPTPPVPYR